MRVDLGELLAGYDDGGERPRRGVDDMPWPAPDGSYPGVAYWDAKGQPVAYSDVDPAGKRPDPAEPIYLGTVLQNLKIVGPPGPPPAWVITDPPHPGQMDYNAIVQGAVGTPPPAIQYDGTGMWFAHPETGERVDVVMPDRCEQCRRHLSTVVIRQHEPVLCDECRDMRNRRA